MQQLAQVIRQFADSAKAAGEAGNLFAELIAALAAVPVKPEPASPAELPEPPGSGAASRLLPNGLPARLVPPYNLYTITTNADQGLFLFRVDTSGLAECTARWLHGDRDYGPVTDARDRYGVDALQVRLVGSYVTRLIATEAGRALQKRHNDIQGRRMNGGRFHG
jgi:hypothetical protein